MAFQSKWIVGKTIESVKLSGYDQRRESPPEFARELHSIRFTDGSRLVLFCEEQDYDGGFCRPIYQTSQDNPENIQ